MHLYALSNFFVALNTLVTCSHNIYITQREVWQMYTNYINATSILLFFLDIFSIYIKERKNINPSRISSHFPHLHRLWRSLASNMYMQLFWYNIYGSYRMCSAIRRLRGFLQRTVRQRFCANLKAKPKLVSSFVSAKITKSSAVKCDFGRWSCCWHSRFRNWTNLSATLVDIAWQHFAQKIDDINIKTSFEDFTSKTFRLCLMCVVSEYYSRFSVRQKPLFLFFSSSHLPLLNKSVVSKMPCIFILLRNAKEEEDPPKFYRFCNRNEY